MRRTARVTLFALVALIAAVVLQPAGAVGTGEQRVLVVLATSGARPYTVAEVERTMHEADGFLRAASLGQVRLHVDVTPWLAAFAGDPGCGATNRGLAAVVQPARFGADRAGYDTSQYDNVIYAIAGSHCGFQGAAFGHEVMLSRPPTVGLVVHELGHAFGLGHAQASNCAAAWLSCGLYDTGDPFSPMGSGALDFSAYEKALLGWIRPQPHVNSAKHYLLAPPTIKTTSAQALLVDTAQGTWWIEYRSHPFRGLLLRLVDGAPIKSPFARSSVLIRNPTKAGRPWIARGESYRIPGSFRVALVHAGAARAEVAFRQGA
jgi:hypothetical protein